MDIFVHLQWTWWPELIVRGNAIQKKMLVGTAVSLFNTAESIATPCSVNAKGLTDECLRPLNRSQFATSSFFYWSESWNLKCSGKRSTLRFTTWLSSFVSTPYNFAISRSIITCLPLRVRIRFSMGIANWSQYVTGFLSSVFCIDNLFSYVDSICKVVWYFWNIRLYICNNFQSALRLCQL